MLATDPFPQVVEDLDLDERLVVESLLVPDDLDGDGSSRAVVTTLEDLTERTLAEQPDDLVPVREVIVLDDEVVSPFVIVAVVVDRLLASCRLLGGSLSDVEDGRVVDDFLALKVRERGVVRLDRGWRRRSR